MSDYIFIDYLDYIFPYSFLISIVVFIICLIYKSTHGKNKVVSGILFFSVLTFLLGIIYASYQYNFLGFNYPFSKARMRGPHYRCNAKIEWEAKSIAAAIANYFSEPDRKQIPSFNELVKSGEYPLIPIDLKRKEKLFKESEFSVDIWDDESDGIIIALSSKEGKCPFYRWKCPRRFKGKFYVLKMRDGDSGVWLDSYEDI
ncbi:hypothetical protein D1BOALGB6SA_4634 [Olavius sp. associated proteobacterium Delta 1]|nr:hypothetical protein D1BOALGB6SA_4634 [Olavius sp. associated proteobacterium Delta 1]